MNVYEEGEVLSSCSISEVLGGGRKELKNLVCVGRHLGKIIESLPHSSVWEGSKLGRREKHLFEEVSDKGNPKKGKVQVFDECS